MKTLVKGVSLLLAALLSVGILASCDGSDDPDTSGKESTTGSSATSVQTDPSEDPAATTSPEGTTVGEPTTAEPTKADPTKGDDVLSIEEIYNMIDEMDNGRARIVLLAQGDEQGIEYSIKADMLIEMDGDLARMLAEMSFEIFGESEVTTEEVYMKNNGDSITSYYYDEESGEWYVETEPSEEGEESDVSSFKELFNSENYEYDAETGRYTMKEGTTIVYDDTEFTEAYIEYKDGCVTLSANCSTEGVDYALTVICSDFGSVSVALPEGIEG